ncbi:MAG: hypothetical protein V3U37_04090 [Nitrospinaceae bacterium]
MNQLESFFPHLSEFAHREIFDGIQQVWDPLRCLGESLSTILAEKGKDAKELMALEGAIQTSEKDPGARILGAGVCVERWIEITSPIYLKMTRILIGPGTVLEPGAVIKGPAVIGANCEVRQGAYIRGNALVGNHCIIGHNTEVKNSIIMNHSEAGHFNYIGDSIIGSYVNMGAGSRLANVQFRSLEEKKTGGINTIQIRIEGKTVDSGLSKFGAILGDSVEVGCNAVLCPGTLVGQNGWIYPNTTVPKGFYAPNTFIAPKDRKPKTQEK